MDNDLVLIGLNTLTLLVGLVLGGGGVLVILRRLKADVPALDGIERIILGTVPADIVMHLNSIAAIVRDAADVVEVVTDGDPNAEQ